MERILDAAEKSVHVGIAGRKDAISQQLNELDDRQNEIEQEKEAVAASTRTQTQHTGMGLVKEVAVLGEHTEEYRKLEARSEQVTQRRKDLNEEQNDLTDFSDAQAAFAKKLSDAGIPHMTILPKEVWNNLLKELGIFRFEDWEDGTVPAHDGLSEFSSAIAGTGIVTLGAFAVMLAIGVPLTSALAVAALLLFGSAGVVGGVLAIEVFIPEYKQHPAAALWTFFGVCAPGIIAAAVTSAQLSHATTGKGVAFGLAIGFAGLVSAFVFAYNQYLNSWPVYVLPKWCLLSFLWPDYHDDGSMRISVRFPNPPDAFRAGRDAAQAAGFDVGIAAESDAIFLDRSGIADALDDAAQERREKLRRRAADPILYATSDDGELVAVIAQFGQFANEERAVKTARKVGLEWATN